MAGLPRRRFVPARARSSRSAQSAMQSALRRSVRWRCRLSATYRSSTRWRALSGSGDLCDFHSLIKNWFVRGSVLALVSHFLASCTFVEHAVCNHSNSLVSFPSCRWYVCQSCHGWCRASLDSIAMRYPINVRFMFGGRSHVSPRLLCVAASIQEATFV